MYLSYKESEWLKNKAKIKELDTKNSSSQASLKLLNLYVGMYVYIFEIIQSRVYHILIIIHNNNSNNTDAKFIRVYIKQKDVCHSLATVKGWSK